MYMRFSEDILTEMVRSDGGPDGYVVGSNPLLSPDGEWLLYTALNRPSSAYLPPTNFSTGSLFLYNTVLQRHTLVTRGDRSDFRAVPGDIDYQFASSY